MSIVGETENESVLLLKKNSTIRWKLGACSSLNSIAIGNTYQYPAIFIERCCLEPGRHTLICYNDPPARGWKNAYMMIDGHRYCDNFVTYKSFQKISVKGKYTQKTQNVISIFYVTSSFI